MGEIQKEEQKTQMFRYKNASLPTQERVNDLLSHMTLREKVGQLNQRLYGFRAYERKGDEKRAKVNNWDGREVFFTNCYQVEA